MGLSEYIAERNGDLLGDAVLQGGMGLVFSAVTFLGVWVIGWFVALSWSAGFDSPFPLLITAVYAAVASWSAWREVDPYDHLLPATQAEATRREVEEALQGIVGSPGVLSLGTREGVAGCATWLIAGPKGVLGGWRALNRRVTPEPAQVTEADALLRSAREGPAPIGERQRAALLLVHLRLADLELDPEGRVLLVPTAKGKRVAGGD